MSHKILVINVDRCVGCYACEIACKQENDLPVESTWCRPVSIGPRKVGESLHLDFIPHLCVHCEEPVCAYFCQFGAITKRQDGVVVIDKDQCTGCGLCASGCPYGAICFDEEKQIAGKCSLCATRIDEGLEPSCVQHCLSGALRFVAEDELAQETQGARVVRKGKVCYASTKWNLHS
jgi:Fe-S-cluster-containing dehydrogenase component